MRSGKSKAKHSIKFRLDDIMFSVNGDSISVQVLNKNDKRLRVERTEMIEWLSAFGFPTDLINMLSLETITSISNDIVLQTDASTRKTCDGSLHQFAKCISRLSH